MGQRPLGLFRGDPARGIPFDARLRLAPGQILQGALGVEDLARRRSGRVLQNLQLRRKSLVFDRQRVRQGGNLRFVIRGPGLIEAAHLDFLGTVEDLLLLHAEFLQHAAIHHLGQRYPGHLLRQDHHWNHIGEDQDDVLRHLSPGHRAHAAKKGTDQDAGQTDEDADLELDADQPAGDQADAIDLRDDVDEGGEYRHQRPDETGKIAAVTRAEKIGNGELPELAQVRREHERHQAEAAGPADHEGQPLIAVEVERAGHADEGGGAHPVRARRHAVEEGRHAPAGDVVLDHVGGTAHHADAGIERQRGEHENIADHARPHAEALGAGHEQDEQDQTEAIAGVENFQAAIEGRLGHRAIILQLAFGYRSVTTQLAAHGFP